jgi:hypothetical protein
MSLSVPVFHLLRAQSGLIIAFTDYPGQRPSEAQKIVLNRLILFWLDFGALLA